MQTIEKGELPILPFELEAAKCAMEKLIAEQDELGRTLREAMDQSSETWHDNAPAEAISSASVVLAESARPIQRILGEGVVFEYSDKVHPALANNRRLRHRLVITRLAVLI